ncbi:MAG: DUF4007 family protein [Hymenobacter sp.]
MLGSAGLDYTEDEATSWYLHYRLVRTGRASLYHFVFNELRKEGFAFSRGQLRQFVVRKCAERNHPINDNTLDSDLTVLLRSYVPSNRDNKDGRADIEGRIGRAAAGAGVADREPYRGRHPLPLRKPRAARLPWPVVLRVILENSGLGRHHQLRRPDGARLAGPRVCPERKRAV